MNKWLIKHFILLTAFFLTAFASEAQSKKINFRIQGNFIGDSTKFITLSYLDSNARWKKDTCNIINNRFSFSGYITEPSVAYLASSIEGISVETPNVATIFIEPKNLKIDLKENHFDSVKIYGSETQKQYDLLQKNESPIRKQMFPLTAQSEKLSDSIGFFLKSKDTVSALKMVEERDNLIRINMKPYTDELDNIEKRFINNNPGSYVSAYLLYSQFRIKHLANDSVEFYYNKLPAYVQNGYWGKVTKKWLGDILPVGSEFPNVSGINADDEKISSGSLLKNNDYTLVIFWASWCIPCRQLTPTYAKIYNKYHNKGLKLIAVTLDNDKKDWLAAIKKDNTSNWAHIFPDTINVPDTYGFSVIPAEILLKGNTVVAKYRGADDEKSDTDDLENKLKEIYKGK